VLVLMCGTYGNVIRLLPPLVIGFDLLDEGLDVLVDAIRETSCPAHPER
jgi:4-aminobutyrate aminotransferase/(S)-3-amino-2-methylpropionate transaminase